MTDAIRELFELLTKKEKSGSDYTGTVTRVDGKTAYVQFDGSDITDTPVALSIGAKEGDSVRIRVADGRAWLVGNDDAPPNDSSKVGYELALTNAFIRQLTTEQINGENGWINLLQGTFNYGNKLIWNGRELTLNGKVVTASGTIGGWNISATSINNTNSSGNYVTLSNGTNVNQDVLVVRTGSGTSADPYAWPFYVRADGTLGATKGKIGPWNIDSNNSIWSGNSAYGNANGMYFGTSGISLSNKFKVSAAGALTSTSGSIGGWNIGTDTLSAESTSTAGTATYRKINLSSSPYASLDGIRLEERATSASGNLRYRTIVDFTGISMRDNVNDIDGSFSASQLMISKNGGTNISYMEADTISTTGTIKEGGTALANKYAPKSRSDIRLKENVDECEVDSALEVIDRIRLHAFDWKDTDVHQRIGVIADELEKLDPMLADGGGTDEDGNMNIKTVNTFYLQGYEVKAIQELHAEVRSLKAEIAELKEIIAVLMEGKK